MESTKFVFVSVIIVNCLILTVTSSSFLGVDSETLSSSETSKNTTDSPVENNNNITNKFSFSCRNRATHYWLNKYADIESNCRRYYICKIGQWQGQLVYMREIHYCQSNYIFDQRLFRCRPPMETSIDCGQSARYYEWHYPISRSRPDEWTNINDHSSQQLTLLATNITNNNSDNNNTGNQMIKLSDNSTTSIINTDKVVVRLSNSTAQTTDENLFSCQYHQTGYFADIASNCSRYFYCEFIQWNGQIVYVQQLYDCQDKNYIFDQQLVKCVPLARSKTVCDKSEQYFQSNIHKITYPIIKDEPDHWEPLPDLGSSAIYTPVPVEIFTYTALLPTNSTTDLSSDIIDWERNLGTLKGLKFQRMFKFLLSQFSCYARQNGYYQDFRTCSIYYHCAIRQLDTNTLEYKRTTYICPDGTMFEPASESCRPLPKDFSCYLTNNSP